MVDLTLFSSMIIRRKKKEKKATKYMHQML